MQINLDDYINKNFRTASYFVKFLKFLIPAGAAAAIACGQWWQKSQTPWQAEWASTTFVTGVILLVVGGIILIFFDKDNYDLMLALKKEQRESTALDQHISYLESREEVLLSWQTVTKVLMELLDQVLLAKQLDDVERKIIYTAIVEVIAEYKLTLFGIKDEYCNISIYQLNSDELLECVGCYRSRPSDAAGEHRKWEIGEGHVGKAFELNSELICADANSPDVKPWIMAGPSKLHDLDTSRYVSLAAVPIAPSAESPLGVLIITSSEPNRFAVGAGEAIDEIVVEKRRLGLAALQDFAAIVGQIMLSDRNKSLSAEDDPS